MPTGKSAKPSSSTRTMKTLPRRHISQAPTIPMRLSPQLFCSPPLDLTISRGNMTMTIPRLGLPPDPSVARPNDYGNSNGVLPETPVRPVLNRPSLFRRVVGVLLPQHYQRVPTDVAASHPVGGGTDNDGVFANVMAKPGRAVTIRNENGDVYMVPEETQNQAPPSYSEAQADAVPPYWETTVHAPSSLEPGSDMIVDDLPTGSWYLFLANVFISYFFQFIGFLFTYLLHTTHAAKYGSRVGLGLTLIQYGFYSRRQFADEIGEVVGAGPSWNETMGMMPGIGMQQGSYDPSLVPTDTTNGTTDGTTFEGYDLTSRDWVAFLLMTLGWFLLLSSLAGFYRVKRWERSIRAASSSSAAAQTNSESRQDNMGRAFPEMFLFRADDENDERRQDPPMNEAEARLARDLRAAGLL
ncbi:hypothetical protein NM688_g222 [Phlebia brevispora]|uniref:Uncharacterized protein n=1 Tax=Phlebia brevispora TaxID=194682 RepID=A0ACC1TF48_9APHY|nr:hypothetical protein NM688_g222 [Phlebia brevispora]